MPDAHGELAEAAALAWERYDHAVRRGATRQERRFTADAAFDADEKLAEAEWAARPRAERLKAAREVATA